MYKVLLLLLSSILMAGGYKLPEVSLNAVGLLSANVAHASGADTSYYNPANMVFMADKHVTENDLTYIGLSDTNYRGTYTNTDGTNSIVTTGHDLEADKENFFIPTLHYTSADMGGYRIGLSIVSPGGLTKRWSDQPGATFSEEFTLKIIEFNPSVAFKLADNLGVAVGARVIYSDGLVKSNGPIVIGAGAPPPTSVVSRDLEGDSLDFGYNIALAYKPTPELELGLTYRSKVDMTLEGHAKLTSVVGPDYEGGASVDSLLPASLHVAAAYTFATETTVEFVYDRTFWSEYKELDFNYSGALGNLILTAAFDEPKARNWKDVSTYRLGITQKLGKTTLMCGIAYDETPIPNASLSFDLPDSDLIAYSFGVRQQVTEKLNLGLSTLYAPRKSREVNNVNLNGKFSETSALLVSVGFQYIF
ncbi:outer membrane protein transport protein [Sulfurimonas sp.]|nr:outer membrane protein transport protein [Sulfurimonas sp.]